MGKIDKSFYTKEYGLVIFSKKTGKCQSFLTATGFAMLELYALQNVKPSQDAYIFLRESGAIVIQFEGNKDFPKVEKDFDGGLGFMSDVLDKGSLADLGIC